MNGIRAGAAAVVFLLCAGASSADDTMRRFMGDALNDGVISAHTLVNRQIVVTDFMGEMNANFTPEERRRGLRGPYYIKFNLRDSKLRCFVSRYDSKNFPQLMELKKNERVSVIGRIDQLATGAKGVHNPYYILRVGRIRPGWLLDEDQEIFADLDEAVACTDVSPQEIAARPEEYAGEYLRVRDGFSIPSTLFTGLERDLNLDPRRALKFYLENFATPCYLPNTPENKKFLVALASGDRVTVSGRLNLIPAADDVLFLFSVREIKPGW